MELLFREAHRMLINEDTSSAGRDPVQAHPGAEETEQHENTEAGWERESQLSHNLGPTTAAAAS